jgi:hypothetical protein
MGLVTWIAVAAVAAMLARLLPLGRPPSWRTDLAAAVVAAVAAGIAATALDFGGWRAADLQPLPFVAAAAFAGIAIGRILARYRPPQP